MQTNACIIAKKLFCTIGIFVPDIGRKLSAIFTALHLRRN